MNYSMYSLLNELRRQSKCYDKQVACIITDKEDNILSVGVNTVNNCNRCGIGNMTKDCDSIHAEEVAVTNIPNSIPYRAYLSLYPCPECQRLLDIVVKEIIVFNKKHKECVIDPQKIILIGDLAFELFSNNGINKQLSIISGELGELVTAISDYFYRSNEKEVALMDLLDEVADVELMIQCLFALLPYDRVLADYNKVKTSKLLKVSRRLQSGAIKRGSPLDIYLPGKELS